MPARKPPPPGSALLTVVETAAELRCGIDHVYNLITDGTLSEVDISRNGLRPKIRVRRDELNALIERRSTNAKRLRTTA